MEDFCYREKLITILKEKKFKNSSYSLRAFARDLDISLTSLSDVLNGKRDFSKKNAIKISEKVGLSPVEYELMLKELSKSTQDREVIKDVLLLKEDEFNLISKWYYLAILSLANQKNINADSINLATRFGINEGDVSTALNSLVRLGYLEIKNKKLKRTLQPIRTTTDVPSFAIKKFHKENLDLVNNSIDNVPVELREITSLNLNIDPNKMKKAKKLIDEFIDKFEAEMEKTPAREVYTLGVHFYPTTLKTEFINEDN